ncbi:MAG: imidazole glycerol phosphate synthase subunit HisH [Candidatus Methanomethylophilaceae archaeon]|nr:imidazole glycerol phosphate synthase subunit HisH [Candidatus Methanomethylophilaceae archaeon]MDD4119352.1 imidazole glycerol phosphate synthase subunit HisH [Candidatus Methanomethylophilaceae archaeon]MDD4455053.1 imidazole glycerol phosphate synthase subunit HisH [Candidatus Methanomethylophilaceae archaeon]
MPLEVTMADYGAGNLHSLRKALERCGAVVTVTESMKTLAEAECIAFPGVGAFDNVMARIGDASGEIVRSILNGTPCLGICIGMQISADGSEEGHLPGIGLIEGRVVRMRAERVPQIGWNHVLSDDPLFEGIDSLLFYFAHSFVISPKDSGVVRGITEYESMTIPSLVRKNNFVGSQFHPEKSGSSGLRFLSNFVEFAEGCL